MVTATRNLHASAVDGVTARIKKWVRLRGTAKEVGRELGADYRTVDSWRDGKNPSFPHLVAMIDVWGAAFLDYVFEPALSESDRSLDFQLANLASQIATIRNELNEGGVDVLENSGSLGAADGALAQKQKQSASGRKRQASKTRRGVAAIFFVAISLTAQVGGYIAYGDTSELMRTSRTVRAGRGRREFV